MNELTKFEEILLSAIIKLGNEAYGFRIRRFISDEFGLDYTYGNIYSALGRLDKKGYVVKRTGECSPARRGKARVYYSISEDGRRSLHEAYRLNQKMLSVFAKCAAASGRT